MKETASGNSTRGESSIFIRKRPTKKKDGGVDEVVQTETANMDVVTVMTVEAVVEMVDW